MRFITRSVKEYDKKYPTIIGLQGAIHMYLGLAMHQKEKYERAKAELKRVQQQKIKSIKNIDRLLEEKIGGYRSWRHWLAVSLEIRYALTVRNGNPDPTLLVKAAAAFKQYERTSKLVKL